MNAEINALKVLIVLLVEFLFGIGFNALVAWAHEHKIWHVSTSVVLGVAITLLLPAGVWLNHEMPFWQAGILLALCFTASGLPMVTGSMKRTVIIEKKDSKKRRAWPTEARHARDDAVMALSSMANDIAEKSKRNELSISHLADYVHRLHSIIGILKSV